MIQRLTVAVGVLITTTIAAAAEPPAIDEVAILGLVAEASERRDVTPGEDADLPAYLTDSPADRTRGQDPTWEVASDAAL